jgi:2-aminoadipate transaminase
MNSVLLGSDWSTRLAKRTAGQDGFLTGILASANARGVINFSGGFPAPELFPTGVVAQIITDLLAADAAVALQYAPSAGIASTLEAMSDHLSQRQGQRPGPGEIMMTSGGIDAVTLIAKSMLDPGDVVAVEEPTYLGAVSGFTGFDAQMRGVPMDSAGLDVGALAKLIASGVRPKLLYTIPDHQNPSGLTLDLPRRRELVELCRSHRILIVEDVAYRELGFYDEPLPSLWSMAPDTVVQIGTFSKTIFPGIRLGWATGPHEIIDQLVVAKQNSDQCAGALGQRMVEQFLRGGFFQPQVIQERQLYRGRGEAMLASLTRHIPQPATWTEPRGGFFTWLQLPGVDTADLARVLAAQQVAFVPGSPFFAERVQHDYLRLSFSRATEADIDEGIARIAQAVTLARTI